MSLATDLLERAARATPADVEDRSTEWWLRHTEGGGWWSGAVLAHGGRDHGGLDKRIDVAERFYAEHRAVPRFQVCDGCPPDLDVILAERGYRFESPVSLRATRAGSLRQPSAAPGFRVSLAAEADEAWLVAGVPRSMPESPASSEHEARRLRRVRLPSAFVTVFAGDEPVSIGRAVADEGWTGVFGMATAPHARRRGAARLVLAAIGDWACQQDADRVYLQVETSNRPAVALYEAIQFAEIATYHYRVMDAFGTR